VSVEKSPLFTFALVAFVIFAVSTFPVAVEKPMAEANALPVLSVEP
jgi:hypothetical protein